MTESEESAPPGGSSPPTPPKRSVWGRWWPAVVMVIGGALAATQRSEFVVYPPAELAAIKDPHRYKGRPACPKCHQASDRRLLREPVALCLECHPTHPASHPTGGVQRAPNPVGLPLGPQRQVRCDTCHDPHDVRDHEHGLRLPFNQLCVRCHPTPR